jgi:hypothetical protein
VAKDSKVEFHMMFLDLKVILWSLKKSISPKRVVKQLQADFLFMRSITYQWNSKALTNDAIRIKMKKCFFVFLSQELPNPNQP